MKFVVPTNWQADFFEDMPFDSIGEFYGKLQSDFIGGKRAAFSRFSVGKKAGQRHIRSIVKRGIRFNYSLNAVCLGNREFTIAGQRSLRRLMDWLMNSGVGAVTVSIPYLVEFIKKHYPGCFVCVSTQTGIKDVRTARYWQDLGADSLTLSFTDINRDFSVLRRIRSALRCDLRLIANLNCLCGCPFFRYHSVADSHASQYSCGSEGFLRDYCFLRCNIERFKNPVEFIRSGWIRPEDVHHYENAGINAIELVNRTMGSGQIKSIVRAYSQRRYEGNLMDLFSDSAEALAYPRSSLIKKLKMLIGGCEGEVRTSQDFYRDIGQQGVFIDNRALDGFIDFFVNGHCICGECQSCGYCEKVAKKTVRIEDRARKKILQHYEHSFGGLITDGFSRS